jgi:hypothetical protein
MHSGLVAEAVLSEPFSPLNSLLTGKNTGNFSFFLEVPAENFTYPLESTGVLIPLVRIGRSTEQGIIMQEQGIIRHVSGKRHFPDIKKRSFGSSIFFTMRPAPAPQLIEELTRFGVNFTRSRFIGHLAKR